MTLLTRASLVAVLLLSYGAAALAQDGLAAKSLFFATDGSVMSVPTAPPAAKPEATAEAARKPAPTPTKVASSKKTPSHLGAGYFIRLRLADGRYKDVLSTHGFQSGEKFQLGVKVNRPSHVYIFNEDPDGKVTQLHPQPGQGALVDAMGVVFLPAQGSFQFDNRPGVEQLSVMLSPRPIESPAVRLNAAKPDLVSDPMRKVAASGSACDAEPARSGDATTVAMASLGRDGIAAKGIGYAPAAATEAASVSCAPQPLLASKAIVFADDAQPADGGQVASYVVKPQPATGGEPLVIKLKLLHR